MGPMHFGLYYLYPFVSDADTKIDHMSVCVYSFPSDGRHALVRKEREKMPFVWPPLASI
jgi:hypothetical protein